MTLVSKNLLYRITTSCGCPLWLSSATFLLVTIVYLIKLLFPYICDPGELIRNYHSQNYPEHVKYGWSILPIRLIAEVLELGFALLALWGIIKKKPFLLLTYVLWSIVLMISIGYIIYFVNKERTFGLELYNSIVSSIFLHEYRPSSIGVIEIMLCLPIVFKGFTTAIVYTYFRAMVITDLQDQRSKVDLNNIKVIIRTQVNEAVACHMNKTQPYIVNI